MGQQAAEEEWSLYIAVEDWTAEAGRSGVSVKIENSKLSGLGTDNKRRPPLFECCFGSAGKQIASVASI